MDASIRNRLTGWERGAARSGEMLARIRIDLSREDFSELLPLLKHSIDAGIASQSLLIGHGRFEGLAPLARKIFETYVQLKYLMRHPGGLRHYALFERLKQADNHRYLLDANRELIADGEAPILSAEKESAIRDQAAKEASAIAYFRSLGVIRKRIKNRYGKESPAKSWFENFKGIPHFGALADSVGERRTHALFYPVWSASQHGQSVSVDYGLRAAEGGVAAEGGLTIKSGAESESEALGLLRVSILAGAVGHMLLVHRFEPEASETECLAIAEALEAGGLSEDFLADWEKARRYLGIRSGEEAGSGAEAGP